MYADRLKTVEADNVRLKLELHQRTIESYELRDQHVFDEAARGRVKYLEAEVARLEKALSHHPPARMIPTDDQAIALADHDKGAEEWTS